MGRVMTPNSMFVPYPGEPWIADNGAYGCWRKGLEFDETRFRKMISRATTEWSAPVFGVLPDIVAGGLESLSYSLSWVGCFPSWRWYLAVQDGMTPDDVAPYLDMVDGIFVGGTLRFKETASQWVQLGLPVHFGRAGVRQRLEFAFHSGCVSADSAFPLWTMERMNEFLSWIDSGGNYIPTTKGDRDELRVPL